MFTLLLIAFLGVSAAAVYFSTFGLWEAHKDMGAYRDAALKAERSQLVHRDEWKEIL